MAIEVESIRPAGMLAGIDQITTRRAPSVWSRLRRSPAAMIGLVLIVLLVVVALTAGILRPEGYDNQSLREGLLRPGGTHLLGTDELGRDLVSRIVYGSRVSLEVGIIATVISAIVGISLGAVAGYMGGTIDYAIQALVDISWAFPTVLMAIFMVAVLGPGLMNVMIAVGLVYWGGYARVVRGQILSMREWDFVTAARALGARPARIIMHHMLPNVIAPVIVMSSLMMGDAILIEATLSFLGMGAQPPMPSWGSILASGRAHMVLAPWIMIFPGLAIMLTVLGFNLLGDGLRDATDPRLR